MKIRKVIACMLCVIVLFCPVTGVFAQEHTDVIRISSLDDFLAFAENCRLDSYSKDKQFLLTCDIDLTGVAFDGVPIFCGTFDGGYHCITGLNIQSAGSKLGLFRIITATGTVKNLNVSGTVQPTGSRSKVGGIAGVNEGAIDECTFEGTVTASAYAGAIAGINEAGGLIRACSSRGSVSAFHFSGGITGSNVGAIDDCHNHAAVNTTAQQNQIDISDINLGTLTNSESASATTDIGGITGANSGTVINCTNRGNVGYKHMGYNVGGIAGLQTGYIANCENFAAISGRKEVGGIAGQQEPQVVLAYQTDTLQVLKAQFAVLSELIKKASANTNANAANIRNLLYRIENHISNAEKAMDVLQAGLESPKLEELQTYLDAFATLRNSIDGIQTALRELRAALDETSTEMNQDIAAITEQLAEIEETLNHAEDNLGGQIVDISDQDTTDDLISKVENCSNHGPILGDLNAGGIVGAIVFENDLDPEEDISVVGDTTLNAIGSLRSVIRNCQNTAQVNAKNQRIGGIAGWITMGLIRDCSNTGSLDNATANYVGGIAGQSAGYIRNCKVKSVLKGNTHVGGVAGSGTVVSECYAMVQLSGNEKCGNVLGYLEEARQDVQQPVSNNIYLQFGVDAGGIDGISYEGMAQGLPQSDFFLLTQDALFDQVTIQFIADGELVLQVVQNAGTSFDAIPNVPVKEGFTGYWADLSSEDLQNLLFDLNIRAAYVTYATVIQSDQMTANGKPILLLQGDFSIGATVSAEKLDSFSGLKEGQTLIDAWEIYCTNCINLHTGRLVIPSETNMDDVILLVRDENGNWAERTYEMDGSYIVFPLEESNQAIALVQNPEKPLLTTEVLIAAGIGALTVALIFAVCVSIRRRNRKKDQPKPADV